MTPRRLRPRGRGTTLVELVVYTGLVATGILLVGSVQLAASRASRLQGALHEVEQQATQFFWDFRRDVEAARGVQIVRFAGGPEQEARAELVLDLPGERQVRYQLGQRQLFAKGQLELQRTLFGFVQEWSVSREEVGQGQVKVTVDLELVYDDADGNQVRRSRSGSAVTRLAVLR